MHEFESDNNDCNFNTHKSDFYTQSVVLTHMSVNTRLTHKCDNDNFHTHSEFDTHECDKVTHDCDFNKRKSDSYTQNVISTRNSVIKTLTRVITTRASVTYTRTS
jgi:hypothetical protein